MLQPGFNLGFLRLIVIMAVLTRPSLNWSFQVILLGFPQKGDCAYHTTNCGYVTITAHSIVAKSLAVKWLFGHDPNQAEERSLRGLVVAGSVNHVVRFLAEDFYSAKHDSVGRGNV
jgi:hypothetical protein